LTKSLRDIEISKRLREMVADTYSSRGRFSVLADDSGVPASRWKNFFYNRQQATQEMLSFWLKKFPNHEDWILYGRKSFDDEEFPFLAPIPKQWEGQTIGDRLCWVITEWASPTADSLFRYLEEKSNGKIPAQAWAEVIMRKSEPTIEMVQIVCTRRPHFTRWVLLGRFFGLEPSVDPTCEKSVAEFVTWQKSEMAQFWKKDAPTVVRDFKLDTSRD
jgi:hypothetical protein